MTGGGAQQRTLTLIKEFIRRGHKVDLVTVVEGGALAEQVPREVNCIYLNPYCHRFLPSKGYRKLKLFLSRIALSNYIKAHNPDLLLSAASHSSLTAIAARRYSKTKTPLVLRLSSHLTASHTGMLNLLRRWRYKTACKWFSEVDAVIAVAGEIADDIIENTTIAADRVSTIYNPTYTPELLKKAQQPIDHAWLTEQHIPVLLGVGRLVERKDFVTLIQAFAEVRKQRPARLMILGEGSRRKELMNCARDLGVEDDIELPGFVSNPLSYMSRASVFVLSSRCEGLPGVLIEAMAAGCPVVSTDCPSGPAEILCAGKFGSLVPVADVNAMAEAIIQTIDHPGSTSELKDRATSFSVAAAVDKYIKVFEQVTDNANNKVSLD